MIPGTGRFPREGNDYPLQYSCLENSMDRGAQRTTVHGVAKSQTLLSNLLLTFVILKAEILKNLLTVSKEIKPVNPKGNQS